MLVVIIKSCAYKVPASTDDKLNAGIADVKVQCTQALKHWKCLLLQFYSYLHYECYILLQLQFV